MLSTIPYPQASSWAFSPLFTRCAVDASAGGIGATADQMRQQLVCRPSQRGPLPVPGAVFTQRGGQVGDPGAGLAIDGVEDRDRPVSMWGIVGKSVGPTAFRRPHRARDRPRYRQRRAAPSGQSASEAIAQLRADGNCVIVYKVGTGSMDHCSMTSVRSPAVAANW